MVLSSFFLIIHDGYRIIADTNARIAFKLYSSTFQKRGVFHQNQNIVYKGRKDWFDEQN